MRADDLSRKTPYCVAVREFKRSLLTSVLVAHGGHRTRAASELGIQRTHLQRLIVELEIRVPPPPKVR